MRTSDVQHVFTLIAACCLLVLAAVACKETPVETTGEAGQAGDTPAALQTEGGAVLPFDIADVYFEFNTTDNDLGFQVFLDAEGWDKVDISNPSNSKVVQLLAQGPLSDLGITELRFESAEPSPAEVLDLFPPGAYTFRGKTVEGDRLASTAELSHDFLPAPTFSPSDGQEVDPDNARVTWDAPDAELVEVIIETEEEDVSFDVIVKGSVTSLDISPQFLEPDTEYKIEILAYHENGNRTIVESTFVTAP